MKTKKLPFLYVLSSRNRLRCRMVLPFACKHWYDPKQHCKYICWHAEAYRNFVGPLKVVWPTWKTLRFDLNFVFWFYFTLKMSMKTKNCHFFMFWVLEIDWDVVWYLLLLLHIDMIPSNIENTLVGMRKPIEKFLGPLKVVWLTWKTLRFDLKFVFCF